LLLEQFTHIQYPTMTDYKISVTNEEFSLSEAKLNKADIIPIEENTYHILHNNTAYNAIALDANFKAKTYTISVNGNSYKVSIADAYDQMVDQMGLLVNTSKKENEIKAPMPGLILDILVKEGQEIHEGTPLLVLSAMKMENSILSQSDGIVKAIKVKKDDAVDKGQLIIEME